MARAFEVADEDGSGLIAELEFKKLVGYMLYFNGDGAADAARAAAHTSMCEHPQPTTHPTGRPVGPGAVCPGKRHALDELGALCPDGRVPLGRFRAGAALLGEARCMRGGGRQQSLAITSHDQLSLTSTSDG